MLTAMRLQASAIALRSTSTLKSLTFCSGMRCVHGHWDCRRELLMPHALVHRNFEIDKSLG